MTADMFWLGCQPGTIGASRVGCPPICSFSTKRRRASQGVWGTVSGSSKRFRSQGRSRLVSTTWGRNWSKIPCELLGGKTENRSSGGKT